MQHGRLNISRPAGYEAGNGAASTVVLYGPRGGFIGDTTIDRQNAEEAVERLRQFAGLRNATALEDWTETARVRLTDPTYGTLADVDIIHGLYCALTGRDIPHPYEN